MPEIHVLSDTPLKKSPNPAKSLTADEMVMVNAGDRFAVTAVLPELEGGHHVCQIAKPEWDDYGYFYHGHVEIEADDKASPQKLSLSAEGLKLIKEYEGCELSCYDDGVGVLTIGYGHTRDVSPGQCISEAMAETLLKQDLEGFECAVCEAVTVPLTQGQYNGLVSFAFNCGSGALRSSTLLKKLNADDYDGATNEFKRWNKGGGQVMPGLVARRASDEHMFRTGEYKDFR